MTNNHVVLPTSRRPTQNDVARIAGVSRGTVSYVVNGLVDGKVSISQETRARVWDAIAQLGYVPDAGARALRSGATHTIGLIIPDLNNPHFWENASGVEQEARAAGYRLLLSSTDLNAAYGEDIFKDLSGRKIDGLVLMGAFVDQSETAQQILKHSLMRRLPIVEISDRPLAKHQADCVMTDYRAATAEVMAHLFALGHRRIGLIHGVAGADLAFDRLDQYRTSLREAGLPEEPELIDNCGPTLEDGYQATRRLLALDQPPTAIVAINDLLAMSALRAARDCGLQVPQDISIIGFDDIPAARYLVPRLTTVSKEAADVGREAARMVLRRIQEPDLPQQIVRVASRVIVRESTAPAPR